MKKSGIKDSNGIEIIEGNTVEWMGKNPGRFEKAKLCQMIVKFENGKWTPHLSDAMTIINN